MTTLDEIRDAINMEARENAAAIDCQVKSAEPMGALWKIWLEPLQKREHLDESLEGSALWWPGPPKGAADILSVVPDEWQINVRFASARPPQKGGHLKIYRPQYLEKLEELWRDERWSARCMDGLHSISGVARHSPGKAADPLWFPRLRCAQREAFLLPQYDFSFLWGPPGTGKTATLGMLSASLLIQFPESRILLLSTTNVAVDEALNSVDDALKEVPGGGPLRSRCQRVGNHFLASRYEGRRHLLPVVDERALQRLVQLEARRPDPADVAAYSEWKSRVEAERRLVRANASEVLAKARLAAMTTTRAVFDAANLQQFAPYDLVIFDEASQVSVPPALGLAPLGRSVIFAGDPKQLAPIVQSNSGSARKWMGESPFQYMCSGQPSACILNEQSRMAEPICRAVSQSFYEGKLIVAEKERASPAWNEERRLRSLPVVGDKAVSIIDVLEECGRGSLADLSASGLPTELSRSFRRLLATRTTTWLSWCPSALSAP